MRHFFKQGNNMKKILFLSAAFLLVAQSFAGSLINKDSKKYDLEINGNSTYIEHNTTNSGQASKGSTIKIKSTGSTIKVDFDGDVVIENGKLSKK